jgi:hypothetical protein
MNEIDTEVIKTKNERETTYAHKGWSPSAISTTSPWTLSRIANNNRSQTTSDVSSITKRVIVQRLRVDLPLEDLIPVPEFEADILAALEKPTKFEKFHALYQVFEHW